MSRSGPVFLCLCVASVTLSTVPSADRSASYPYSAIETNWVNSESMAASVSGIALHTPTASKEVLSLMISIFKVKKTWGFASVFVQILERMKAMDV